MKRGKCIWQEDDAPSYEGKERIEGAWQRLFGEPYPGAKAALESEDDVFYLMPNGAIACESYEGNSAIYERMESMTYPEELCMTCDHRKGSHRFGVHSCSVTTVPGDVKCECKQFVWIPF